MNQQKNKQKFIPELPKNIKEQVEAFLGSAITKVEYKTTFFEYAHEKNSRVDEFIVNDKWIVRSYEKGKTFQCGTLDHFESKRKIFGQRVRTLMNETGVPWELAKIVVTNWSLGNENYFHLEAINDCEIFKQAKEDLRNSTLYHVGINRNDNTFGAILEILKENGLNRKYDLRNRNVFSGIKKFLFEETN